MDIEIYSTKIKKKVGDSNTRANFVLLLKERC